MPTSPESGDAPDARAVIAQIFALLASMEAHQTAKVIALARRIVPHLTAEDLRNPHDFPDLDDPDWHFEDGQLTGIQSVRFALRGLTRDLLPDDEAVEPEGRGQGSGESKGAG